MRGGGCGRRRVRLQHSTPAASHLELHPKRAIANRIRAVYRRVARGVSERYGKLVLLLNRRVREGVGRIFQRSLRRTTPPSHRFITEIGSGRRTAACFSIISRTPLTHY